MSDIVTDLPSQDGTAVQSSVKVEHCRPGGPSPGEIIRTR